MKKVAQKLTLVCAIIIILGHSSFPHDHHFESNALLNHSVSDHYQDNDQDDNTLANHSIFSFFQIDENYVPANFLIWHFNLSVTILVEPFRLPEAKIAVIPGIVSSWLDEFPPPNLSLYTLAFRGPPIV